MSFVVLAFLMVMSFVVSEYEYNKVQQKYENAFNEANATIHNQTIQVANLTEEVPKIAEIGNKVMVEGMIESPKIAEFGNKMMAPIVAPHKKHRHHHR